MFLNAILEKNRKELKIKKQTISLDLLKAKAGEKPPPIRLSNALKGSGLRLIAEVKRASPSRGLICPEFDHIAIAKTYVENGAAAISVLTETNYFQGKNSYLSDIKKTIASGTPVLRKDFIFDPYQVYESRAIGADALLLITAILPLYELKQMLELSWELGMECLVEVHNKSEVSSALKSGAKMIGINNRDLNTLKTDLFTTEQLRPLIPPGVIAVSESGIKTRSDINKLRRLDVNAVLIGESLVSAPDIVLKMRELLA